jgi:RNA polymerase sigma-70 factor (ECF subfamily)
MPELSDDLVAAATCGDTDALAAIYAALAPKVLGYLRARGAEDPEGLTSEVFLNVIDKLGRVVGGAAGLRAFVFSVAHARYVDESRRRARRPAPAPYEPDLDDRQEPSAETSALHSVATRQVHDLLDRLGDDQRSVITLRVLGDLTLEETARVLGRSTGAVKQLQRRGLIALRGMVQQGQLGDAQGEVAR